MIDNHEMVLPLVAAAFIAKVCSRLVCPTPLFHMMAQNFVAKLAPAMNFGSKTAFTQRKPD